MTHVPVHVLDAAGNADETPVGSAPYRYVPARFTEWLSGGKQCVGYKHAPNVTGTSASVLTLCQIPPRRRPLASEQCAGTYAADHTVSHDGTVPVIQFPDMSTLSALTTPVSWLGSVPEM